MPLPGGNSGLINPEYGGFNSCQTASFYSSISIFGRKRGRCASRKNYVNK